VKPRQIAHPIHRRATTSLCYSEVMTQKITTPYLRKLNGIMAALHAIQGMVVLALSRDFTLPISGNFLSFNNSTQSLEPATTTLFNLSLPLLIAGFFFLSAGAHLIIATAYNKTYVRDLAKGINKARWIEYSISASIMMVAISLLVGIYDLMSLVMIFALVAIMNLLGLAMEVYNQGSSRVQWLSYWLGCIAGIVPWLAIAFYLWLSADNGSPAPTFVYWIFVSIFIFFNCFAINMALQYKKIGPWKDYLYGERSYIFLSLVAKSLLA
jgi:Heliorhodopsin